MFLTDSEILHHLCLSHILVRSYFHLIMSLTDIARMSQNMSLSYIIYSYDKLVVGARTQLNMDIT